MTNLSPSPCKRELASCFATTLTWNFGDGSTATGQNPSHTYTATGTYTIKLTSSKTGLTSKSVSQTLIVAAAPPPPPVITAFKATADAVAPSGTDTLTWTVSGATSLSLDNGIGTVTGTSKAITLGSNTTTYTLTATNAGGSATAQVTVIVDPLLSALTWKRDIVYLGGKEVAEYDANGMHVTHEDHLGSPRFITNSAGAVESRQKYLPFGETLDAALSGTYAPGKGFTNHEQTDASGAIYMQARYYLPQWHRFNAPDPARDQHFEQTQSWNIYSYVQNDPTMRVDPTGMFSFKNAWQKLKNGIQYGHWETDQEHQARTEKYVDDYRKANGYDKFDKALQASLASTSKSSKGDTKKLASAQDAARANPAFAPKGGNTYCNLATLDTAKQMGADTTPLMGNANAQADNLARSSNYHEIPEASSQGVANSGGLVISAWHNPEGHGHSATVRPEGEPGDSPKPGGKGPLINNVGRSIGVDNRNWVYPKNADVHYYVPNGG